MVPKMTTSKSQSHTATKRFDNRELVKTSFWISQICMILATIAGVYLASQEGLSQAIRFDDLLSKKDNYYLRYALHDEVSDNIKAITVYTEEVRSKLPQERKHFRPTISTFVWENMRYSPNTLETPASILSDIRRFYMQVDDVANKIANRTYAVNYGVDILKQLTKDMEQKTLPKLKENYQALAQELKNNDIIVE